MPTQGATRSSAAHIEIEIIECASPRTSWPTGGRLRFPDQIPSSRPARKWHAFLCLSLTGNCQKNCLHLLRCISSRRGSALTRAVRSRGRPAPLSAPAIEKLSVDACFIAARRRRADMSRRSRSDAIVGCDMHSSESMWQRANVESSSRSRRIRKAGPQHQEGTVDCAFFCNAPPLGQTLLYFFIACSFSPRG